MTEPIRAEDGARDALALLEAFVRNDLVDAQAVLEHCDPASTICGLASAWVALVEFKQLNARELLDSMRDSMRGTFGIAPPEGLQ